MSASGLDDGAIITALDMLHESALDKRRLAEELEGIQLKLDAALTMLEALMPMDSKTEK